MLLLNTLHTVPNFKSIFLKINSSLIIYDVISEITISQEHKVWFQKCLQKLSWKNCHLGNIKKSILKFCPNWSIVIILLKSHILTWSFYDINVQYCGSCDDRYLKKVKLQNWNLEIKSDPKGLTPIICVFMLFFFLSLLFSHWINLKEFKVLVSICSLNPQTFFFSNVWGGTRSWAS